MKTRNEIPGGKNKNAILEYSMSDEERDDAKAGNIVVDRVRYNMAEFSRAADAGWLLRTALKMVLLRHMDVQLIPRMVKRMMEVVRSDQVNEYGKRTPVDGDLRLLTGFEFNQKRTLFQLLGRSAIGTIQRKQNRMAVSIPSMPKSYEFKLITRPTHFRMVVSGAAINFQKLSYHPEAQYGPVVSMKAIPAGSTDISLVMPPAKNDCLVLVAGVEFLEQLNGKLRPWLKGSHNVLSLIAVDTVP
jgi:hypothetical protein